MARKTPVQIWGEYLAGRSVAAAVGVFDIDTNLRTAVWFGKLLHLLDAKHRDRCRQHIRIAYPDWSGAQVEKCVEGALVHLAQLAFETVQTPRALNDGNWTSRADLSNLAPALEVMNAGRPCLLMTGHLGNWEVLGSLMALLGYRFHPIARPLDNPLLNDWVMGLREDRGLRIITKFDSSEEMMRVLRANGTLSFLADQNAGEKAIWVPWFGRLASTYKSIALLAMRYRAPIVCGYAHRTGPKFHFEVGCDEVIHPEEWEGRGDAIYYITARYTRAIENMVRRRPEQYFWMHRRWKTRPRWERQGKPAPPAARRLLEALGWLGEAEIERCLEPL